MKDPFPGVLNNNFLSFINPKSFVLFSFSPGPRINGGYIIIVLQELSKSSFSGSFLE